MRYDDDGYCSDDTFVDIAERKKTCQSFTCMSPLFILSRWLNGRNSRKKLKKMLDKEKLMKGNHDIISDETGKDSSFNLGLGFGLLYLIAASRNIELNKADNNKQLCVSSSSNINTPHKKEGIRTLSSRGVTLQEIIFGSGRFKQEKSLRMDQLEAELEAEFDRIQLQQHEDYFSEANIEDSAQEESNNMSPEVINDHDEVYERNDEGSIYNEFYSVPAIELERKLHELLEERQEEKINELELALEYAVQQLQDREIELSWWRDTARLVCKHLPEIRDLFERAKRSPYHSTIPEIIPGI